VKSRIVLEVTKLKSMPEMGHLGSIDGTREMLLAWSYIAVYRIIRDEIQILRIRHAAQQWPPAE
jgi:plasmid stabilization system protein ParE